MEWNWRTAVPDLHLFPVVAEAAEHHAVPEYQAERRAEHHAADPAHVADDNANTYNMDTDA